MQHELHQIPNQHRAVYTSDYHYYGNKQEIMSDIVDFPKVYKTLVTPETASHMHEHSKGIQYGTAVLCSLVCP